MQGLPEKGGSLGWLSYSPCPKLCAFAGMCASEKEKEKEVVVCPWHKLCASSSPLSRYPTKALALSFVPHLMSSMERRLNKRCSLGKKTI
nr:hypothetical protein Iba_scaffold19979CG0010 [Ipomoea batatas]